jgi:2-oxo-4-hydroxy-4-carboxy--5-ureidoimidazoline (OHCU) decarboxylase
MASLPTISAILSSSGKPDDPLAQTLALLFEPSPILYSTLVPQLVSSVNAETFITITTYSEIIYAALECISSWGDDLKSQFIAGHPRIGETKNLSNLSAKEQGDSDTAPSTSPEVLERLVQLNALYERRYPGLRYITFVNGRSRAAIMTEMEDFLGVGHSSVLDESPIVTHWEPVEVGGEEWRSELNRAIIDIGRIANSRLKSLRG